MDTAPWIKYQAKRKVRIIGSFENECGERYVLFRHDGGDTVYFTGDEVNWKPERLWPTQFMFNADERAKIAKLLWCCWSDLKDDLGGVTYSPEMEQMDELIQLRAERSTPVLDWDATSPAPSGGASAWSN